MRLSLRLLGLEVLDLYLSTTDEPEPAHTDGATTELVGFVSPADD
jgi:hypothetical protein